MVDDSETVVAGKFLEDNRKDHHSGTEQRWTCKSSHLDDLDH